MDLYFQEEGGKMDTKKFTYFQEEEMLVGWLEEFPDYKTQGETLEELKENLRDLYRDLSSNAIPHVLHVSELDVA
jgi:hypothetical protein